MGIKFLEFGDEMKASLDKQASAHKELIDKYDKEVTKGIIRQMDPKIIFKGMDFDDPLDLKDKKDEKKKKGKNKDVTPAPF